LLGIGASKLAGALASLQEARLPLLQRYGGFGGVISEVGPPSMMWVATFGTNPGFDHGDGVRTSKGTSILPSRWSYTSLLWLRA